MSTHRSPILLALIAALATACPAPNPVSTLPGSRSSEASLPHSALQAVQIGDGTEATRTTLADVKQWQARTEGKLVNQLPKHNAITSLKVRKGGLRTAADGDATVGLGMISDYEEDLLFETHPDLLDEEEPLYSAQAGTMSTNAFFRIAQTPASIDLRPTMPAVRNQGDRMTCVYFATLGVLDHLAGQSAAAIKTGSPQHYYWNYHRNIVSKVQPQQLWTDSGASIIAAGWILDRQGLSEDGLTIPPNQGYLAESMVPYSATTKQYTGARTDLLAAARYFAGSVADRISAGNKLSAQSAKSLQLTLDLPTLKQALAERRPVVIGYPVGDDWYQVTADNDIVPELTPDKLASTGGHAVVLVGYEDNPAAPGGGYFIVRNSWDKDWGKDGYCRVSYAYTQNYGNSAMIYTLDGPVEGAFQIDLPPGEPLQQQPGSGPEPNNRPIVAPSGS